MLSRVADLIYWLNRYIERAENYARFMDVTFNLSLELPPDIPEQWLPLIATSGDWDLFHELYNGATKANVIRFLGFDTKNPNSIYNCIIRARENARAVRPEITKEVWEQLNRMYLFMKDAYNKKKWLRKDPRAVFDEIKQGCHLFYGILDATISRNELWHFGSIGRLTERADKTSRILDVKYHILGKSDDLAGSTIDIIQWAALLKSVSAYDMYRKKYGNLQPKSIVEFLVLDKLFPRSISRCVNQTEFSLYQICGDRINGYMNSAEKKAGIIRYELEYSDINDVFDKGLHQYLDGIQIKLNSLSDEIYKTFFSISKNGHEQYQL